MEKQLLKIDEVPAVLYGAGSVSCFLYIHGKLGFKEEAETFAEIAVQRGWQVLSIDLPEHGERKEEKDRFNPWCVIPELKMVLNYMKEHYKILGLRANSIGAWFAMQSYEGLEFDNCLLVSPVLDMEKLIQDMMGWAAITEERLKKEGLIPTEFGETLSWKYYEYAKKHPVIKWQCQTHILYAEKDNMTNQNTVNSFAQQFHASLTIMKDGEHWFHTADQLAVLNRWISDCIRSEKS